MTCTRLDHLVRLAWAAILYPVKEASYQARLLEMTGSMDTIYCVSR